MAENETQQQGLQEHRVFQPPAQFAADAAISGMDAYRKLCDEAEPATRGGCRMLSCLDRRRFGKSA